MFGKKQQPEHNSVAANHGSAGSTFSVLGADTSITGDISASADLHIDGRVEGNITCASLVQGETSEIQGNVSAESARLSGAIQGSITARELVILKSARINGDVHYDALTIEQGAMVEGKLSPRAAQPSRTGQPDKTGDQLTLSEAAE